MAHQIVVAPQVQFKNLRKGKFSRARLNDLIDKQTRGGWVIYQIEELDKDLLLFFRK